MPTPDPAALAPPAATSAPAPRASFLVGVGGALASTAIDAALLTLALGGIAAMLAEWRALALLSVWFIAALILAIVRPVRAQAGTRRIADPFLLVALLVLPLVAAPLAAWGERLGLWLLPGGAASWGIGLPLVLTGLTLRIAAMAQLGSRFDPTVAILPGHALETRGLYRRMRHPGYTGAWLAALGAALTFHSALGLLPVALMALALMKRVQGEERVLEEQFGDEFRAYRGRTGAFLPR